MSYKVEDMRLSLEQVEQMDVIESGQYDDLISDDNNIRIWVSR